jgi:oligosaccharide repeat unit polymerase
MAGVWAFWIGLYYLSSPVFFPIENKFPLAILIWVVSFCAAAVTVEYVTLSNGTIRQRCDTGILKLCSLLALGSSLFLICRNVFRALNGKSEMFFLYLRTLNTGLDESIEKESYGILPYFTSALLVVYLISLIDYRKDNKKWVIFLLVMNLLMVLVTMAKSGLFVLIFSSLVVLHLRGKIRMKQMILPLAVFMGLCILIQTIRDASAEVDVVSFFDIYLFSGAVAFDNLDVTNFSTDGSNVFRLFYAVAHTLGFPVEVKPTILDYTSVGNMEVTNVYTVMYPYYVDFGYVGVFIFGLVNGAVGGALFRASRTNHAALVLYALFASFVFLGFLGDFFITNLSSFIQYVIYACLPFYFKLNRSMMPRKGGR